MDSKIISIVAAGILATLVSCADKKNGQTVDVEGTVKNTTAGMIYLEEDAAAGQPVIMDSSVLNADGHFKLQAPTKEESLYQLRLKGETKPLAFFINDAPSVTVQADAKNTTQPYSVSGSKASEALVQFDKTLGEQATKIMAQGARVDSLKNAQAADSVVNTEYLALEATAASAKTSALDFIRNSKSPVLSVYAISSFQNHMNNIGLKGFSRAEIVDAVNEASAKFPAHAGLQTIKKSLAPAKAPDFTQPDPSGKPVSLSSFKGKYVLVDFWASWCPPCRKDNPNVVKAYNEFKDKNFTILGVSLDQSKEAWLQAIQQDGLTWTHVSDLKFWSNEAAALYGVQAIPANFLIDPQGNIVAQDLHGEEIAATLRRIIK